MASDELGRLKASAKTGSVSLGAPQQEQQTTYTSDNAVLNAIMTNPLYAPSAVDRTVTEYQANRVTVENPLLKSYQADVIDNGTAVATYGQQPLGELLYNSKYKDSSIKIKDNAGEDKQVQIKDILSGDANSVLANTPLLNSIQKDITEGGLYVNKSDISKMVDAPRMPNIVGNKNDITEFIAQQYEKQKSLPLEQQTFRQLGLDAKTSAFSDEEYASNPEKVIAQTNGAVIDQRLSFARVDESGQLVGIATPQDINEAVKKQISDNTAQNINEILNVEKGDIYWKNPDLGKSIDNTFKAIGNNTIDPVIAALGAPSSVIGQSMQKGNNLIADLSVQSLEEAYQGRLKRAWSGDETMNAVNQAGRLASGTLSIGNILINNIGAYAHDSFAGVFDKKDGNVIFGSAESEMKDLVPITNKINTNLTNLTNKINNSSDRRVEVESISPDQIKTSIMFGNYKNIKEAQQKFFDNATKNNWGVSKEEQETISRVTDEYYLAYKKAQPEILKVRETRGYEISKSGILAGWVGRTEEYETSAEAQLIGNALTLAVSFGGGAVVDVSGAKEVAKAVGINSAKAGSGTVAKVGTANVGKVVFAETAKAGVGTTIKSTIANAFKPVSSVINGVKATPAALSNFGTQTLKFGSNVVKNPTVIVDAIKSSPEVIKGIFNLQQLARATPEALSYVGKAVYGTTKLNQQIKLFDLTSESLGEKEQQQKDAGNVWGANALGLVKAGFEWIPRSTNANYIRGISQITGNVLGATFGNLANVSDSPFAYLTASSFNPAIAQKMNDDVVTKQKELREINSQLQIKPTKELLDKKKTAENELQRFAKKSSTGNGILDSAIQTMAPMIAQYTFNKALNKFGETNIKNINGSPKNISDVAISVTTGGLKELNRADLGGIIYSGIAANQVQNSNLTPTQKAQYITSYAAMEHYGDKIGDIYFAQANRTAVNKILSQTSLGKEIKNGLQDFATNAAKNGVDSMVIDNSIIQSLWYNTFAKNGDDYVKGLSIALKSINPRYVGVQMGKQFLSEGLSEASQQVMDTGLSGGSLSQAMQDSVVSGLLGGVSGVLLGGVAMGSLDFAIDTGKAGTGAVKNRTSLNEAFSKANLTSAQEFFDSQINPYLPTPIQMDVVRVETIGKTDNKGNVETYNEDAMRNHFDDQNQGVKERQGTEAKTENNKTVNFTVQDKSGNITQLTSIKKDPQSFDVIKEGSKDLIGINVPAANQFIKGEIDDNGKFSPTSVIPITEDVAIQPYEQKADGKKVIKKPTIEQKFNDQEPENKFNDQEVSAVSEGNIVPEIVTKVNSLMKDQVNRSKSDTDLINNVLNSKQFETYTPSETSVEETSPVQATESIFIEKDAPINKTTFEKVYNLIQDKNLNISLEDGRFIEKVTSNPKYRAYSNSKKKLASQVESEPTLVADKNLETVDNFDYRKYSSPDVLLEDFNNLAFVTRFTDEQILSVGKNILKVELKDKSIKEIKKYLQYEYSLSKKKTGIINLKPSSKVEDVMSFIDSTFSDIIKEKENERPALSFLIKESLIPGEFVTQEKIKPIAKIIEDIVTNIKSGTIKINDLKNSDFLKNILSIKKSIDSAGAGAKGTEINPSTPEQINEILKKTEEISSRTDNPFLSDINYLYDIVFKTSGKNVSEETANSIVSNISGLMVKILNTNNIYFNSLLNEIQNAIVKNLEIGKIVKDSNIKGVTFKDGVLKISESEIDTNSKEAITQIEFAKKTEITESLKEEVVSNVLLKSVDQLKSNLMGEEPKIIAKLSSAVTSEDTASYRLDSVTETFLESLKEVTDYPGTTVSLLSALRKYQTSNYSDLSKYEELIAKDSSALSSKKVDQVNKLLSALEIPIKTQASQDASIEDIESVGSTPDLITQMEEKQAIEKRVQDARDILDGKNLWGLSAEEKKLEIQNAKDFLTQDDSTLSERNKLLQVINATITKTYYDGKMELLDQRIEDAIRSRNMPFTIDQVKTSEITAGNYKSVTKKWEEKQKKKALEMKQINLLTKPKEEVSKEINEAAMSFFDNFDMFGETDNNPNINEIKC